MCRLLAKVNYRAEPALYELIEAPHSLKKQSVRARLPGGYGAHNDGCGIAWLQDGALELVKRGKPDSWDSEFCSLVTGIATPIFIAHNRAATPDLQVAILCRLTGKRTFDELS
jgi:predicted glutamine amidotransferase